MTTLTLDQYRHLQDFVEALESGKYEQVNRRLRLGNCYCVMGVACDLYDSSRWKHTSDTLTYAYAQDDDEYPEPYIGSPPLYVVDYFGLTDWEVSRLIQLNDNHNYTFKEIAEWIKQNVIRSVSEIYKD